MPVDTLNQTFGNGTVFHGGAFGVTDNAPMRIAFTRIPTPELEEIDHRRNRRVRGGSDKEQVTRKGEVLKV